MYKKVRLNYLKLILPLAAVLLICAAVLLALTRFGIRYGLVTSLPVESIPAGELKGACAQVQVNRLEGTFARSGHITQAEADEDGTEVDIIERFCMAQLDDGRYIAVRVNGKHLKETDDFAEALSSLGEEAKSMNFGLLRGTVNEMPDSMYELFKSWADEYIKDSELEPGTEEFYNANICPLILDTDYYGPFKQGTTIFITLAAGFFAAVAIVLLLSGAVGVWDKNIRREAKAAGKAELEKQFGESREFAGKLYLGKKYIWCFKRFTTDILKTADVVWAYPRSRRLEGGKLEWLFVMKTGDKREYSALLGEATAVQAAEEELKKLVHPLCIGFDKEKQKLYDKDISTFKARVKNGTI